MTDIGLIRHDEDLQLVLRDRTIGDYRVDDDSIDAVNTPKPYIHPLRTLGGRVISGFAPSDHPWHHGLQFAMPRVGAHNMWGGGTYFGPERGYVATDDHGQIRHESWTEIDTTAGRFTHRIGWLGSDGTELLQEERTHRLRLVRVQDVEGWLLQMDTVLTNATDQELRLETPAQRGRPDGGYGGWFLRFAEGFAAARLTGDGEPVTASGVRARTLVIDGRTASGESVTVGLHQGPATNPGSRRFLYRFDPFPLAGFAVAYDEGLLLAAGESMALSHRIACFDGSIDPELVCEVLEP
ncbi:DUF6807 family protein [Microbacterium sp. I2]|uniref:DUF6807 family protein n=1 Tax=Microbacterium sp. I2 TaxID=3391826 RepID=UPI003EDA55C6